MSQGVVSSSSENASDDQWRQEWHKTHKHLSDCMTRGAVALQAYIERGDPLLEKDLDQYSGNIAMDLPLDESVLRLSAYMFPEGEKPVIPKKHWERQALAEGQKERRNERSYLLSVEPPDYEQELHRLWRARIQPDERSWAAFTSLCREQRQHGRMWLDFYNNQRLKSQSALKVIGNSSIMKSGLVERIEGRGIAQLSSGIMRYTPADFNLTPIGPYGREPAINLAYVGRVGHYVAGAALRNWATLEARQMPMPTAYRLARFYTCPEGGLAEGLHQAHVEGHVSNLQALSQLMSEIVEGYDSPEELMQDIRDERLIQKLICIVPQGLIGPMTLGGYKFTEPLQRTKYGLQLNPALCEVLRKGAEEQRAVNLPIQKWLYERLLAGEDVPMEDFVITNLATICPAATNNGAHQQLLDTQLQFYAHIAKRRKLWS